MIFIQHHCMLHQSWIQLLYKIASKLMWKSVLIRNESHTKAFQTILTFCCKLLWILKPKQRSERYLLTKHRKWWGQQTCSTFCHFQKPKLFLELSSCTRKEDSVTCNEAASGKRLLSQTKTEIMYFSVQLVPHLHWLYYSSSFLQLHAVQYSVP